MAVGILWGSNFYVFAEQCKKFKSMTCLDNRYYEGFDDFFNEIKNVLYIVLICDDRYICCI